MIKNKINFEELKKNSSNDIESFIQLGLGYLRELGHTKEQMESNEKYRHIWSKDCDDPDEYYLRSIIKKVGEKDRWLIQLKSAGKIIGFVHGKIDKDEKVDRGYVMEFYISDSQRLNGYGKALYQFIEDIFKERQVESVWLEARTESAIGYWKHLGFCEVENNSSVKKELSKPIII